MGTRRHRQRQEQLWITHTELATAPGHPFYKRLSEVLDGEKFDEFCERECAQFYADSNGRPSLTPGTYFRLLLVGYFEGIDSERGIAWRVKGQTECGKRAVRTEPAQTEQTQRERGCLFDCEA